MVPVGVNGHLANGQDFVNAEAQERDSEETFGLNMRSF
jgi:hypothetical protein